MIITSEKAAAAVNVDAAAPFFSCLKEVVHLKCRDLQMMISDFIEKRLTDQQLEIFLEHITGCQECYDELEVYYMITIGLRQLDEDHTGTLDLKRNLREFIEEQRRELYQRKRTEARRKQFRLGLSVCLAAIILFSTYIFVSSEEKIRSIEDFRIAAGELIQEQLFGAEQPGEAAEETENPIECRTNFEKKHPLIPYYFYYSNIKLLEP